MRQVRAAHAWFRDWLFDAALPFWASAGHAGAGFGAHEHLRLDGSPGDAGFKRMRVQARQIYAFSQAALLGWPAGERLARDGYAFITWHGERADGGWVRTLSPSGDAVLDPATDLYDQAFVLFALAWYARLTHSSEPLQRARRTLDSVIANMAAPHGGFHNVVPLEPGPRQQNPHMHLLEAVLALHETTGEARYAAVAHDLVALFRDRFFDAGTGAVGELYHTDWSPMADGHVEPGHHYEWVWLLDQYERQTGQNVTAEIDGIYRFARSFGTEADTGVVWDRLTPSGAPLLRSTRLWPQTESLKAHAVMARRGGDGARLIAPVVHTLRTRFLAGCPWGGWIDQFDAEGEPTVDKIPTSSFYHIMMGYAELDRLVAAIDGYET